MILQINLKLVIFGSSSQIEKLSKWRRICDLLLFPLLHFIYICDLFHFICDNKRE